MRIDGFILLGTPARSARSDSGGFYPGNRGSEEQNPKGFVESAQFQKCFDVADMLSLSDLSWGYFHHVFLQEEKW